MFLHRDLGLSPAAAQYRKTAAELLQRFPPLEAPLRDGRLCLMTLCEVAKVLTPENQAEVLPRFFGRSQREAKEVVVELHPAAAPRRDVVTALAQPAPLQALEVAPAVEAVTGPPLPIQPSGPRLSLALPSALGPGPTIPAAPAPASPSPSPSTKLALDPDVINPCTATHSRLHTIVSRTFLAKLAAARAARSHAQPGATTGEILEAALDLLLDREARRRGQTTRRPRARRPAQPDHVPAQVRAEVWSRDEARCQWPVHSGGSCGSTLRVELHHVHAKARGGPPTAENLQLLCQVHHAEATMREFGAVRMGRPGRSALTGAAPPGDGIARPAAP
jgi:hypothetical protein